MRGLKILVIGMGVLIVVGTVTLVALLVQRAGGARQSAPLARIALDLPAGSQIVSVAGAGERFAVLVRGPAGDRILLLDGPTGRLLGEIAASGQVPPR